LDAAGQSSLRCWKTRHITAAALCTLLMLSGNGLQAAQASSTFSVEVAVQRPGAGTSCTVSRDRDVKVSCAPYVPSQILNGLPERQAFVGGSGAAGTGSCGPLCGSDDRAASWRFEYLVGEHSTKTVIFGHREYLEMTISW
jgi:hypothetical protein